MNLPPVPQSSSSQSLPAHAYSTDLRDRDSLCPSPPSSLCNYPLHHRSHFKPTSTPYSGHLGNGSGHAPLLGHSLITGSNSSIRSAGSAHSHLDGHSYSRPDHLSMNHHSRVQSPFSRTPSYHSTSRHGDNVDIRKSSTRGRYTTSSVFNHTPSNPTDHAPTDLTSSSQHRTLTPSDPGSVTGVGREKSTLTWTSHRSEPSSPDVELQRSKLKVKKLEREVRRMFSATSHP